MQSNILRKYKFFSLGQNQMYIWGKLCNSWTLLSNVQIEMEMASWQSESYIMASSVHMVSWLAFLCGNVWTDMFLGVQGSTFVIFSLEVCLACRLSELDIRCCKAIGLHSGDCSCSSDCVLSVFCSGCSTNRHRKHTKLRGATAGSYGVFEWRYRFRCWSARWEKEKKRRSLLLVFSGGSAGERYLNLQDHSI